MAKLPVYNGEPQWKRSLPPRPTPQSIPSPRPRGRALSPPISLSLPCSLLPSSKIHRPFRAPFHRPFCAPFRRAPRSTAAPPFHRVPRSAAPPFRRAPRSTTLSTLLRRAKFQWAPRWNPPIGIPSAPPTRLWSPPPTRLSSEIRRRRRPLGPCWRREGAGAPLTSPAARPSPRCATSSAPVTCRRRDCQIPSPPPPAEAQRLPCPLSSVPESSQKWSFAGSEVMLDKAYAPNDEERAPPKDQGDSSASRKLRKGSKKKEENAVGNRGRECFGMDDCEL